MSTISFTLKTHNREDITSQFIFINDCIVHKCKPTVLHIVAGKRKESHWVVLCKDEDCNKISMQSPEHVVTAWNFYNPTTPQP